MDFLTTDYLLIHGYAQNVTINGTDRNEVLNQKVFGSFEEEIAEGRAFVFNWGIPHELFSQSRSVYGLYKAERQFAQSNELVNRLIKVIKAKRPQHIVCHSMGCYLLLNVLNSMGYSLPTCVKKITFIQADIAYNTPLTNIGIQMRMHGGDLDVVNTYCPWDHALLSSSLIHRQKRAGLQGWEYPGVENMFHPLTKLINTHQNVLNDEELKLKIV